ncbi:Pyrimidine reductase riboflavin biosynthesis [Rubrobacter radiotolerans]|uniref:Pyrimidine reductase riboflavin biosynthesis n=1 Tax=Rubrobacter radiotolerans TaxID=42256 RepID=A0A023X3U2_RUBRA|nr:RibD family protein [Rubrobacter radiotolerans]AHY46719.1 Pyrimidine reductase riboflavin biosynthesis [Rubrobacter radiotolerans]MDX5894126.1 RibD family protein [Rubrobacter radiotolerans]SMC05268.1 riboflavin-specific deaminase C-terminal domain-containing protein [Rubrobacter radiotolerans DSM 5868]
MHERIELQEGQERPYTVINMVCSLDGRVSVNGRSGSIGSREDRETMRVLRSKVDAVMVGSGTLRSETVSLTTEGRKDPEPYAVIPSLSLDLDLESNLKNNERDRTLVLTTRGSVRALESSGPSGKRKLGRVRERATLLTVPEREGEKRGLDLSAALGDLRSRYDIRRLLVEGGPSLNHALISSGLVDEIFLTLSPKILGGEPTESLNLTSGPVFEPGVRTELISAEPKNSELFLRYRIQ